jgi:MFS family permease
MTEGIRWRQVGLLLLLEAAVAISWIAYHEYQPEILEQFGFSSYALEFAILQAVVLIVTPPIAGQLSDNIRNRGGNRLPIINIGVSLVSMIFMCVAATIYWEPTGWMVFLVPVFVTFWLISMNLFRSPAISLVETFVPQAKLATAISVFVLVFDLIYALEPSIVDLIQWIGAPVTFAAGGMLVFISGFLLMRSFKQYDFDESQAEFNNDTEDGQSDFWRVISIGLGYGMVLTGIFKLLPYQLSQEYAWISDYDVNANFLVSGIVGLSAFTALWLGRNPERIGLKKMLRIGFNLSLLALALLMLMNDVVSFIIGAIVLVFSFAMLSVSALPTVFYKLSAKQTVLGVGLYYSAIEIFAGLGDILEKV